MTDGISSGKGNLNHSVSDDKHLEQEKTDQIEGQTNGRKITNEGGVNADYTLKDDQSSVDNKSLNNTTIEGRSAKSSEFEDDGDKIFDSFEAVVGDYNDSLSQLNEETSNGLSEIFQFLNKEEDGYTRVIENGNSDAGEIHTLADEASVIENGDSDVNNHSRSSLKSENIYHEAITPSFIYSEHNSVDEKSISSTMNILEDGCHNTQALQDVKKLKTKFNIMKTLGNWFHSISRSKQYKKVPESFTHDAIKKWGKAFGDTETKSDGIKGGLERIVMQYNSACDKLQNLKQEYKTSKKNGDVDEVILQTKKQKIEEVKEELRLLKKGLKITTAKKLLTGVKKFRKEAFKLQQKIANNKGMTEELQSKTVNNTTVFKRLIETFASQLTEVLEADIVDLISSNMDEFLSQMNDESFSHETETQSLMNATEDSVKGSPTVRIQGDHILSVLAKASHGRKELIKQNMNVMTQLAKKIVVDNIRKVKSENLDGLENDRNKGFDTM